MKVSTTAVYLTDNGAAYCGNHLGNTARMTGRDLSGQPIMEVTAEVAAEAKAIGMPVPCCEICGAQWDDAAVFAGHIAKVATMSATELAAVVVAAPRKRVRAIVR